jgi:cystathionine beta-lyase
MSFSISQFDKVIDRTTTSTIKWDPDYMRERFNRTDLLPFNHAELDFECPLPVVNAIKKRAEHPIYGYTLVKDEYYDSVINWFKTQHNITYERKELLAGIGIIHSYRQIINHFTQPGDEVLVFTPIYRPFFEGVKEYKRKLVTNSLHLENRKYFIDFELLERTLKSHKIKLLAFVSPHNPIGRVWREKELKKLGDLCLNYKILIVSDAIHSELTNLNHPYTPLASISDEIADNLITLTAPTKTFNLSGMKISNYHIKNQELRENFYQIVNKKFVYAPNVFAITALMTAYNECAQYASLLRQYLDENFRFMEKSLSELTPKIEIIRREGTPTVWLDFRKTGISHNQIFDFILDKANIITVDGLFFGNDGNGFQRMSLGLPRSIIIQAMENLKHAMKTLG